MLAKGGHIAVPVVTSSAHATPRAGAPIAFAPTIPEPAAVERRRKPRGLVSPRSHAASVPEASVPALSEVPKATTEMVWNGDIPRLLRKLPMGTATPSANFGCASFSADTVGAVVAASSRAASTARRLKLEEQPHYVSHHPLEPRTPRPVPAHPHKGGAALWPKVPIGGSTTGGRARARGEQSWLAPDERNLLEVAMRRRKEFDGLVPGRARDTARNATAHLSAVWHDPGVNQRQGLTRLQMLAPSVDIERVLSDHSAKPRNPELLPAPRGASYLPRTFPGPRTPARLGPV
jgi:hypothetical protein